ncbi:MAG: metallophosphoesterase [Bryobacteraceae bacterium]
MATLVIPDVHERTKRLTQTVNKYLQEGVDQIVFLGDFFDNPYSTEEDIRSMARWLAAHIDDPRFVFLLGNHDMQYGWPSENYCCDGFTEFRQKVINEYMTPDHWRVFRLFTWVGKWLLSHAGLSPRFVDSKRGFTLEELNKLQRQAFFALESGCSHPFIEAGLARDGDELVGGINWLDWNLEFMPIKGLNQIVGHSVWDSIRYKWKEDSMNYNIDTYFRCVAILRDDKTSFEAAPYQARGTAQSCVPVLS